MLKNTSKLPDEVRSWLIDFNCWLVGSGAEWYLGNTDPVCWPRDLDVLVPPDKWGAVTRNIRAVGMKVTLNAFGGLKAETHWPVGTIVTSSGAPSPLSVDVWPDTIDHFFDLCNGYKKPIVAVKHFPFMVLRNTAGVQHG